MERYEQKVFVLERDRRMGLNHIVEITLSDFLKEYCESDPARAWHVKEVDDFIVSPQETETVYDLFIDGEKQAELDWFDMRDKKAELIANGTAHSFVKREVITKEEETGTRFEVRENPCSQLFPNRLIETFETEEEAVKYILDGLWWDYNNLCENHPAHNLESREGLEQCLREEGIHFVSDHRLEQIDRATKNREERRKKERQTRLAAFAGDDAAVIREWYRSEMFHPAPQAVMDAKERLNLTWKEVRVIGRSDQQPA